MGRTKSGNYSAEQLRFASFNRCLANPARIAILEFLLSRKSTTALDLIEAIDLEQSTVRGHLKIIVSSGLAKEVVYSTGILYKANYEGFQKWYRMLGNMRFKFIDLEEGRPSPVFDINKVDLSIWDDELEGIKAANERMEKRIQEERDRESSDHTV